MRLHTFSKITLFSLAIIFFSSFTYTDLCLNDGKSFVSEKNEGWIIIQNKIGVNGLIKKEKIDGISQVRIKFENTTNGAISFNWSLSKGEKIYFNNIKTSIEPLSVYEVDYTTMMIPINENESLTDISILINL